MEVVGDLQWEAGGPAYVHLESQTPGLDIEVPIVLWGYLEKAPPFAGVAATREVSLLDGWVSRIENLLAEGGATVLANHLIVGGHCASFPKVDCRRLTTDRLAEWLSERPFEWRSTRGRLSTIRIQPPAKLTVALPPGGTVALATSFTTSHRLGETTIGSTASARFDHPHPLAENEWEELYVQPFRAFVSFVTGRECRITDSRLLLRTAVARDISAGVTVRPGSHARVPLWSSRHVTAEHPVGDWEPWRHVLPRREILGDEAGLLGTWWGLHERLGVILLQLVSSIHRRSTYDDSGFFALVSSLEAYAGREHKGLWKRPQALRADLRVLKRAAAGLANGERLRSALAHVDEATFAELLSSIANRVSAVLPSIGWTDSLAREIKSARNHLAHGRGSRAPDLLAEPGKLVEATDRLRALAVANLLADVGLGSPEVQLALDRSFGGYRWYSRQSEAPIDGAANDRDGGP